MTVFEVQILSDFVCPWCYIGKRRLDKAITLYRKTYPSGSQDTFNFIWLPYYLEPDASPTGIPLNERFAQKYSPERAEAVKQRLVQIGLADGLSFTFDGKIGSTRNAHRLIELAKTKEVKVQTVIMERLFENYFEGNADITDLKMLCEVGGAAGLDAEECRSWLESDQGGEEVDRQAKFARETLGSGVPRYIFQGSHHVDGADDPSAFLEVFHQIKSEETAL